MDDPLEVGLVDPHLAQMGHRLVDIVGTGTGEAVAVPDAVQDSVRVEVAGIVLVLGTGHVAPGVDFLVANTDAQALKQSTAPQRIQLGTKITQGLGAGSRPEIGRAAAEAVRREVEAVTAQLVAPIREARRVAMMNMVAAGMAVVAAVGFVVHP